MNTTIGGILVTAACALGVGYAAGRYEGAVDLRRIELHAARQIAAEASKQAAESTQRSIQLDARIDSSNTRSGQIKAQVRERLSQPVQASHDATCDLSDARLDRGTVGLLNAARADLPAAAASGVSDEEGAAASSTSVADLIDNDLDVVRLYHELAQRHNELVDFISDEMKKRASP
jgi:hypothetical protein